MFWKKRCFSLTFNGKVLDSSICHYDILAVARSEKAFGRKFESHVCAFVCSRIPSFLSTKKNDFVIGDPWFLEDVERVEEGKLGHISIPRDLRNTLCKTWGLGTKVIVFKHKVGPKVYVIASHATLRKDFEAEGGVIPS
jgi:hypothetical protein